MTSSCPQLNGYIHLLDGGVRCTSEPMLLSSAFSPADARERRCTNVVVVIVVNAFIDEYNDLDLLIPWLDLTADQRARLDGSCLTIYQQLIEKNEGDLDYDLRLRLREYVTVCHSTSQYVRVRHSTSQYLRPQLPQ